MDVRRRRRDDVFGSRQKSGPATSQFDVCGLYSRRRPDVRTTSNFLEGWHAILQGIAVGTKSYQCYCVRLALKVTWDASILDLNEVAGRREITRLESLAVNGRSTRCSCRAVGQQCFDVLVVLHAPVPASTNRLHIGLDIEH